MLKKVTSVTGFDKIFQRDAQHDRKVARPHAGTFTDVVVCGANGERHPDRAEHQTREKVFVVFYHHVIDNTSRHDIDKSRENADIHATAGGRRKYGDHILRSRSCAVLPCLATPPLHPRRRPTLTRPPI